MSSELLGSLLKKKKNLSVHRIWCTDVIIIEIIYMIQTLNFLLSVHKLWRSKRLQKTHTHTHIFEIVNNEQTAEQNKEKASFKENGETTTFSGGAGLGVVENSASIHGK